ncbi:MAG: S9 family peptidase [Candidatus Sericytochromatia bacterium]|nr:S9 family peptidase [Candidatus Sericytochromatia bacterium]
MFFSLKNKVSLSSLIVFSLLSFSNNSFAAKKTVDIKKDKTKISKQIKNTLPLKYMMPPKEIADLVDAPLTPIVSVSPDKKLMLMMNRPSLPSISDFVKPEFGLAGVRINPKTGGTSKEQSYNGLKIKKVGVGKEIKISGLPKNPRINFVDWSADSKYIAFVNTTESSLEMWIVNTEKHDARKLSDLRLNATNGKPFVWLSDNKTLICTVTPGDIGNEPEKPRVPFGPVVQESIGRKAPSRTYQDLLTNPYDENLFDHYFTSKLVSINLDGKVTRLSDAKIISDFKPSPDGKYILVEKIHKPYSYLVPIYRFPRKIEVLDINGNLVKNMADLPLAEEVSTSFGAVEEGRREFGWRADKPATLYWVEAQDKGDPNVKAKIRDIVYTLPSPFKAKPISLISLSSRFKDVVWGSNKLAMISEYWWKTRNEKTWITPPDFPQFKAKLLFDRSSEDAYNDPGNPVMKQTSYGTNVLDISEKDQSIYLTGKGASIEGDRPFLDKLNLKNLEATRLWRSTAPYYENMIKILDQDSMTLLTKIESVNKQPNYYIRSLSKKTINQITDFPHPTPQLAKIKKQLISYKRDDGVTLNATLYTPEGYTPEKDGRLPVFMWAYPREFKDAAAAGQVSGSPYEFIRIFWGSPLFWVTHGYAILDGPAMPIIGEGDKEPNDTYVKQLVASAKAAVDEVVRMGVGDKDRIAVGGHSYGAFMTANLLAHSRLFKAGIARSGAYNRTLTPFGFQSEERNFWKAPNVYSAMSPFNNADKIKDPLLLIHGIADDNPGTFPLQSERLYNAIKGLGGKSRLVMLPNEAHHYQARESVMHMLWEMTEWLDKYVKNPEKPVDKTKK